ncbi:MAG TPA: recombinase family protein [Alphaproteobacteria bacterium]|nr:recombinase family protein [Alphaproteobacteria bacterium]
MAEGKFVAYYRVSTARQGRSGLGLEAQRKAVMDYLNGGKWKLEGEYTEVESGKRTDRPELSRAIGACRRHKATLVIAKLDRLSRDAHFLLGLQKAGIEFVAADMPTANRLTVGIMALVAEEERRMISKRTREALAAAKARGVQLGSPDPHKGATIGVPRAAVARKRKAQEFAASVLPAINELRTAGLSLRAIAKELTDRGIASPRGGSWGPQTVANVLARE